MFFHNILISMHTDPKIVYKTSFITRWTEYLALEVQRFVYLPHVFILFLNLDR